MPEIPETLDVAGNTPATILRHWKIELILTSKNEPLRAQESESGSQDVPDVGSFHGGLGAFEAFHWDRPICRSVGEVSCVFPVSPSSAHAR